MEPDENDQEPEAVEEHKNSADGVIELAPDDRRGPHWQHIEHHNRRTANAYGPRVDD